MALLRLSACLLALALLGACSEDKSRDPRAKNDGTGDGAAGGGGSTGEACVGAPGESGTPAADVSLAAAVEELHSQSGMAQNQVDVADDAQLPQQHRGVLARGPCDTVGLAFLSTSGGVSEVHYADLTNAPAAPELVEANGAGHDFSLLFDAGCEPIVIRGEAAGFTEYRKSGGSWTGTPVGPALSDLLGDVPQSFEYHSAHQGRDGKLHVFAHAESGRARELVYGDADADAPSWTFQTLPFPPGTEVFAYRVDSMGVIYAVFVNTQFPCDPCDVGLYLGRLEMGGAWEITTLHPGVWGPPEDQLAATPSLALDGQDRPVVVAHFQRRVVTGSFIDTSLRAFLPASAGACEETIADANDSFAGDEGTRFTGGRPFVRIDDSGRIHVVFNDLSVWHDSNGENEIRGSLRYAVRSGGRWDVFTVIDQAGQTESANPLEGFLGPRVEVAPDGATAYGVGVDFSWATDSIYLTASAPVTHGLSLAHINLQF